jgi:hypothetical protein
MSVTWEKIKGSSEEFQGAALCLDSQVCAGKYLGKIKARTVGVNNKTSHA